jgi:AraC-like DNA-binding protein
MQPRSFPASEPTLAARLVRPFVEVLAARRVLPEWLARSLAHAEPDERMPLATALGMLESGIAMSGDPDLGLHAALRDTLDAPLLEYAAVSSATVREALAIVARYIMVINDGLDVRLQVDGDRARLEFEERVPMGRASMDFVIASYYLRHLRWQRAADRGQTEIFFRHPGPDDLRAYERVFGTARVHFAAGLNGVTLPAESLDQRMALADPRLHELLLRSIEEQLAELPERLSLSQRVRALIRSELAGNVASSTQIAHLLKISSRTLSRRLEQEGTSFKALHDQVRCGLAVRYLLGDELAVPEVSQRLGFADSAAFYKAFRRWFNETPSEFIRRRAE